jgi:excisionase family DNA binding protein
MELSIREAAELLGRSERTLRHLAQGGRLPARRIGARWVIRRDDLEEWARTEASATERGAEELTTHTSAIPDADETTPTLTEAVTEPAADEPEPRPRARAAPHTPSSSPPEPAFTVSFEALIPSAPGAREPGSARDLDAFAIATALLSELTHARRHPSADASLLADPERALLDFLQLIADGAHHRDPRRQSERFREAQSRACAALSGLVHYNRQVGSAVELQHRDRVIARPGRQDHPLADPEPHLARLQVREHHHALTDQLRPASSSGRSH